jgi:hypothetical protein
MNAVMICRDGLEDSVLGNLALARAVVRNGGAAAVVFAGEALAALHTGTFQWSRNFKTRDARIAIVSAAEEAGLALGHGGLDHRWSDVRAFVRAMGAESNLRLIACPLWSRLLKIESALEHLERIDEGELVELLRTADAVVGGY